MTGRFPILGVEFSDGAAKAAVEQVFLRRYDEPVSGNGPQGFLVQGLHGMQVDHFAVYALFR